MQTLHQIRLLFSQYLSDHNFERNPTELYEPVNYLMSIGGKRLRPLVLLLAHSMYNKEVEKSLPAALAIEVFHNFSLMHDDIMDEAPLRRGKPTVHKKYNINTGILSGDVMLVYAFELLQQMPDKKILPEILKIFTKVATEVCQGQQMDMNFENRKDVSIKEYLRMIELKTAVLVAGAMKIGARLGGADLSSAKALYQFGRNLGIAFQLQDDLLDTFGDPKKFGKKVGGDISQNKKTFLILKALELASPDQKEELNVLYQLDPTVQQNKINRVIHLFNKLGVRQETELIQEKYKKEALISLDSAKLNNEMRKIMETFASNLMNREV